MSEQMMETNVVLLNQGMKFSCTTGEGPPIITDYYPPLGNNEGYKPLELFLASLGTCFGGTVLSLLRMRGKEIENFELKIAGHRKEEHPTMFDAVTICVSLRSSNVSTVDMEEIIQSAEEKYCPVWAMIKNNVSLEVKYEMD